MTYHEINETAAALAESWHNGNRNHVAAALSSLAGLEAAAVAVTMRSWLESVGGARAAEDFTLAMQIRTGNSDTVAI